MHNKQSLSYNSNRKSEGWKVNHELIRRILPKGTSFQNLTQDDISNMMNHINSYKRKLNNRSPYETFSFYHGEEVLQKLGCKPVAAGDIYK